MTDFGRDISCLTSIRTGRYATGIRLVAEACYRRLSTPRGRLVGGEDEADYGFDLTEQIGTTSSDTATLAGRIQSELLKDERVASVDVTVKSTSVGPGVSWVIGIEAVTAAGPFSLTLSVTDVTISVLGIQAEG